MTMIEKLQQLLNQGQDNALLRYSLGNAYLQQGEPRLAIEQLRAALKHDPQYSAAWRSLGQALTAQQQIGQAIAAYDQGITVATAKGDKQAAKEMQVFVKRLRKTQNGT